MYCVVQTCLADYRMTVNVTSIHDISICNVPQRLPTKSAPGNRGVQSCVYLLPDFIAKCLVCRKTFGNRNRLLQMLFSSVLFLTPFPLLLLFLAFFFCFLSFSTFLVHFIIYFPHILAPFLSFLCHLPFPLFYSSSSTFPSSLLLSH